MTEQVMAAPAYPGDAPKPKRHVAKGMLPASWIGRGLKIEYRDAEGKGQTISGKFLDNYPAGPVLGVNGYRPCVSWDAAVLYELEAH